MQHTATTELEAINTMLSVIGESPVNTVEGSGVVDAVLARQILHEVSRHVQARGWHWNTDCKRTLPLSYPEKEIILPANTLSVDTTGPDAHWDVVQRGSRLYDRLRHTFQFERPLTVDLVTLLPFDDLPQAAREYIVIRAGRIFQDRVVGSEQLNSFTLADEQRSWACLHAAQCRSADFSVRRSPTVSQLYLRRGT